MQALGLGIIGTGWVAQAHAENWRVLDEAQVVGVCSRRQDRAEAFRRAHAPEARAYDDLAAMLADGDVHVVAVCTPHAAHPSQTIAAAKAGKHVVIEKPVALDRASLREMIDAVHAAGVLTSVCFELHWMGSIRLARTMVERGELGSLFYGEASYHHGIGDSSGQFAWGHHTREGGRGAFWTAGCHALDALIHIVGQPVEQVVAASHTSPGNRFGYEYDPNAVTLLRFRDGMLGKVGVSIECQGPYHFPVLLQGEKGTLVDARFFVDRFDMARGWIDVPADEPASGDVADHPYAGQFREFAACIRERRRPHNDLAAAAHVHEVMLAIDQSIESGGWATVTPTAEDHA